MNPNNRAKSIRNKGKRSNAAESGTAAGVERLFAEAVACFQEGRFGEAERALSRIQRSDGDHPDVLHLLALVALQTGRAGDAVENLQKAVAKQPTAERYNLLGAALRRVGRIDDAVDAYKKAVSLDNGLADAHYNLANALRDVERTDEAISHYRQAVNLKPDFTDAQYNLALALKAEGRFEDAVVANRRVLELVPDDAEAYINLGNALQNLERLEEAVAAFEAAIALQPESGQAYNNLGNALKEQGNPEAAVANLEKAITLSPDDPEAHSNLGGALRDLGRLDEAATALDDALDLMPDHANALCNLGSVLADRGEFEKALATFDKALALQPDHVRTHVNKAGLLLLTGKFEEGWKESEWRWRFEKGAKKRQFPQSPWQGEPLGGRTILFWGEQGVGDEVLFAGMVPDLLEAGAKVILECDERLIPIFERSFVGVDCLPWRKDPVPETRSPDIDFQVPGGALGRWLRPDAKAFPDRRSYLAADQNARAVLRERYRADDGGLLVGISWFSKNKELGLRKSLSLMDWRPLADVPGVRFVDLQYGDTASDREAFANETGVEILHDETIDQMKDLDAFAAQVAAMDLVISVSNTTVHMAGALGVPTWVMLNAVPLSCWMLEGDRSPWYHSVRLFRQVRAGRWADVIARVRDSLVAGEHGAAG